MSIKKFLIALWGLFLITTSCNNDDVIITSCNNNDESSSSNLNLSINGLEDLGANFKYEGWVLVNGSPISTGVFTVNSTGVMSQTSFPTSKLNLKSATKFILTIEPFPDTNPAPSDTHLLAGDFVSNLASLSIDAPEALNNTFASAVGKYILATPSDGFDNNEKSGLWFLSALLPPEAGLTLPVLPAGWKYEGWAIIDDIPVTTGTFTDATKADEFSEYSGTMKTPPFPGEDFILNAPSALIFPTDLSGGKVVISIEPFPDNSPSPFLLKPLLADISTTAMDHVVYDMNNIISSTAPVGTAIK